MLYLVYLWGNTEAPRVEKAFEELGKGGMADYFTSLDKIMSSDKLNAAQSSSRVLEYMTVPIFEESDDYEDENTNESETHGRYAGSYAQDVEGLSDNFIDEVLDGDPDAYWNID